MAIIKAVNSKASIAKAINYIMKHEKTERRLVGGYNCNLATAIDDMKATKRAWRKTGGRQYKHFIQSFPKEENITVEEANQIAYELITRSPMFCGYEVCFATHKDKDHIHTHWIVNSVSFEHGYKFRYSKAKLQELKDLSDRIVREHGKSICQKNSEITAFDMGTYKAIEKAVQGTYQSWVFDTMKAIVKAKSTALSRQVFIQNMEEQGFEVQWTDRRKYIVFIDKDGHKIRDRRLSKIFKIDISKEGLENDLRGSIEETGRKREFESDAHQSRRVTGYADQYRRSDKRERGTKTTAEEIRRKLAEIPRSGFKRVFSDQSDIGRNKREDARDRDKQRNAQRQHGKRRRQISKDDDRCL
nr:relaxase/mobilization nuclease domain-containing protein [uncultured Christensenella sp.]